MQSLIFFFVLRLKLILFSFRSLVLLAPWRSYPHTCIRKAEEVDSLPLGDESLDHGRPRSYTGHNRPHPAFRLEMNLAKCQCRQPEPLRLQPPPLRLFQSLQSLVRLESHFRLPRWMMVNSGRHRNRTHLDSPTRLPILSILLNLKHLEKEESDVSSFFSLLFCVFNHLNFFSS